MIASRLDCFPECKRCLLSPTLLRVCLWDDHYQYMMMMFAAMIVVNGWLSADDRHHCPVQFPRPSGLEVDELSLRGSATSLRLLKVPWSLQLTFPAARC